MVESGGAIVGKADPRARRGNVAPHRVFSAALHRGGAEVFGPQRRRASSIRGASGGLRAVQGVQHERLELFRSDIDRDAFEPCDVRYLVDRRGMGSASFFLID